MLNANPPLADDPRAFRFERPLLRAFVDIEAKHRETALVTMLLAGFTAAWFAFYILSLGPLDVHPDLGEMSVWAQHFAFGYKHPPMSGWIFALWFSIFPREPWAAHLLAVTTVTLTLAITWRLLRDHLDVNRALLGLASLVLVPLYTFQASKFNANLVMMPFWAAALLYYLRARRTLRASDAMLAGACLALTFLGKYWAIYLVAAMLLASFVGTSAGAFWRSRAPYAMAIAALIVVAPHLVWLLTSRGSDTDSFLLALKSKDSFGTDFLRSLMFWIGSTADVIAPLVLFAALRPNRPALADTILPRDESRRLALVLLVVPLVLPGLANLAMPHRLTALWTFPNWAVLPLVLFGSPLLGVPALAAMRGLLIAALVTAGAVIAAPFIGVQNLHGKNQHRQHAQQLAGEIGQLANGPVQYLSGDADITQYLLFPLPSAQTLHGVPPSGARMALVCPARDTACQSRSDTLAQDGWTGGEWTDVTLSRSFLGVSGSTANYRVRILTRK